MFVEKKGETYPHPKLQYRNRWLAFLNGACDISAAARCRRHIRQHFMLLPAAFPSQIFPCQIYL
jgi:hypothetical protein